MKKLYLLIILIVSMTALFFALGITASAETYGILTYEVSNGEVTITDCNESVTEVEIPAEINGYPVISIGNYAFSGCNSLASIIIPDSVTSIGNYVFRGCNSLTNITIPDSVAIIDCDAFDDCSSLASITVDVNNVYYSSDKHGVLFNNDKTKLIQYPIGNSRTEYTIPDSVTTIRESAFYYCTSLVNVEVPDSVTSIGERAFSHCTSLTSITIPDSVTSIGDYTFNYCILLTSITIPNSVTIIGENAFGQCGSLASITIPNSVTSIGDDAFSACSSLASITIPDSVTTIGDYAFAYCSSLANITISDSVTSIGYSTFSGCSSLASITIPDSVTTIGDSAFRSCTSLANITISDSVTSLGAWVFDCCYSLASITIPASVVSIGVGAFNNCDSLANITVDKNNLYYLTDDYGVLFDKDKTNLIYCPADKTIIDYTIPDSVTSIGAGAFSASRSLVSISIPDSVTIIGDNAFSYCNSLTSITIPDSVTNIGIGAFSYCNSLTSIIIPDGVTSIEMVAFENCKALVSVVIPDSVIRIGEGAFNWCDSLKNIYYKGSVEQWNKILIEKDKCHYDFSKMTIFYNVGNGTHVEVIIPGKDATCTENGLAEGTKCLICGEILVVQEEIPATGHIPGAWEVVTKAQVGVDGLQQQKCTVCGEIVDEKVIPALPDYIAGDANGDGKITAADARIALRISAKVDNFEDYNLTIEALDVTGDGKLTAADARKILRVAAKIDTLDNSESVVPAADFERLKEILLQTLNEPFDYRNNDAEYVVEHVLYDDVWAFGYQIYSDEILILYDNYWGNDDPDPYGRFGCYFILDAETVKWICEEIYHVECNETEYNSDNSYFYNGKLYLGCSGPVGLDGGLWVDLNSYTVNPEGKYEIIAKKYYESNLLGTYSILAEWTEIDGEYLWTFYSIEKV